MKFNFKGWNLGGKIIFISACLAFISYFFKWVNFGIFSQNGFQQQTYFLFLLFLYPLLMLLKEKNINLLAGYTCSILGVLLGMIYVFSKSGEFAGVRFNAAGLGPYLFIIACGLLAYGINKYAFEYRSSSDSNP